MWKLAAGKPFLNLKFCTLYETVTLLLGFYVYRLAADHQTSSIDHSVCRQDRDHNVAWYGECFFHESVTLGKLAGIALIVAGIILFSSADRVETVG